jgi:multiple antibiotic resistance protein
MVSIFQKFFFLFAVIDPLGSVPVFLEATKNFDDATKKNIAIKAILIAVGILLFFVAAGQIIMESMHITLSAFQISGGVILFLFALSMVFGEGKPNDEKNKIKDYEHVTLFPLAMPSLASPGAIMAVVLLTDNNTYSFWEQTYTSLVLCIVMAATLVILLLAKNIQKRVGEMGIMVISKVMGLILASFAIQSILTGIKDYFHI